MFIIFQEFSRIGGKQLLKYGSSLADLLEEVYSEYEWLPWKFEQSPKHYWSNLKNVRKFMDWAGKQLNVKEMSDWYNVSFTVENYVKFR